MTVSRLSLVIVSVGVLAAAPARAMDWPETIRTLCSFSRTERAPEATLRPIFEAMLPNVKTVAQLNELAFGSASMPYPDLWRVVRSGMETRQELNDPGRTDWYLEGYFKTLLALHRDHQITEGDFVDALRRFFAMKPPDVARARGLYFVRFTYGYSPFLQEATYDFVDEALNRYVDTTEVLIRTAELLRALRPFFLELRAEMTVGGKVRDDLYGAGLPSSANELPYTFRKRLWDRHVGPVVNRGALPADLTPERRMKLMETLQQYGTEEAYGEGQAVRRYWYNFRRELPLAMERLREALRQGDGWGRRHKLKEFLRAEGADMPFDILTTLLHDLQNPEEAREFLGTSNVPYFLRGLSFTQVGNLLQAVGTLPVFWANAAVDDFLARGPREPLSRAEADILAAAAKTAVLSAAAQEDLQSWLATAPAPAPVEAPSTCAEQVATPAKSGWWHWRRWTR